MSAPNRAPALVFARGLAGALLGALAGYFLFDWTLQFGVLVLALPGALVGILCGSATRVRSLPAGIMAGVIALVLSIYIEWRFFPFAADKSLAYFLAHLHQASGQTWIMILGGTLAGFWFGWGRSRQNAYESAA